VRFVVAVETIFAAKLRRAPKVEVILKYDFAAAAAAAAAAAVITRKSCVRDFKSFITGSFGKRPEDFVCHALLCCAVLCCASFGAVKQVSSRVALMLFRCAL